MAFLGILNNVLIFRMIHAVDWHPTIVSIAGGKTGM